jgi:prepilin-type N-terminal cleavage/methylation domain-containing protein
MRSTRGRGRRDALGSQRGVSLIEALVASALLGIGVVVGLTTWDTATMTASQAVRQSWARCTARSELDAILAAPWSDDGGGYHTPSSRVVVSVRPVGSGTGAAEEQQVIVRVLDLQSDDILFEASALKVAALQGNKPMDKGVTDDIRVGCPVPS